MTALGIDFGTSALRAAICTGDTTRVLQFADGAHALPAVVSVAQGAFHVGRAALARASTHPKLTVRALKRFLGRSADDPLLAHLRTMTACPFDFDQDGTLAFILGDQRVGPAVLASRLIRHAVDLVERSGAPRPESAVLCVPHDASPARRKALSDAATCAGLTTLQLLNEPTATALSLVGAGPDGRLVAIVDVGAGGCSASILEVGIRGVRLLAAASDPIGGGDDFDWALLLATLRDLEEHHGPFPHDPSFLEMLRQTCEGTKRSLDHLDVVPALIPFLPVAGGLTNQQVLIGRHTIDLLTIDLLARVGAACRKVADDAALFHGSLSAVIATGGMSSMPVVRNAIEAVFGKLESRGLDLDGSVAIGAALHAAAILGTIEGIPVIDLVGDTVPLRPREELIAVVSTAHEPSSARIPIDDTSTEFSLELARLLAALGAGAVSSAPLSQRKASAISGRIADLVEESQPVDATIAARRAEMLRKLWSHLAIVMQSGVQCGWAHPHAQDQIDRVVQEIGAATREDPGALTWDVGFWRFSCHERAVWEPDQAPWNRVPFDLFSSGVRKLQLQQGLTAQGLQTFLGILLQDPSVGSSPGDDLAGALWEAKIPHVAYVAVDSFDDLDDPVFEDAWNSAAREVDRGLRAEVGAGAPLDGYAAAFHEARGEAVAVALDDAVNVLLRDLIRVPESAWFDRFARGFLAALDEAARQNDLGRLWEAIAKWACDRAERHDAAAAMQLIDALDRAELARQGPGAAREVRRLAQRAIFTAAWISAALSYLGSESDPADQDARAFSAAVDAQVRDTFFPLALAKVGEVRSNQIRGALLQHIARFAEDHEAAMGELLRTSPPEQALDLLATLRDVGSPEALAAAASGLDSPHAVVRLQTIAWLAGESVTVARDALARLLEDSEPSVRQEALQMVSSHHLTVAGPLLVRRAQSVDFDHLPLWERKALLLAVAALSPHRAETLAIAMLDKGRLFTSEALEQSRAIAAEFLGESSSQDALDALERAVRRRWLNSQALRNAAARGANAVSRRRSSRPPPPRGTL